VMLGIFTVMLGIFTVMLRIFTVMLRIFTKISLPDSSLIKIGCSLIPYMNTCVHL
jgi:hypothetical protein